jgi:hypothetical protein
MKRRLKEPFGKAGLTVAICALVLAMVGGAYAAGALTGKQKKEVEKIAKKYAGKPGAPGANGTNGSPGAAGKDGTNGTNGTNGKDGVSAEGASFIGEKTVGSVTCKEGGVEVKSATPATAVCNGKKGTTGFTETLPKEKTETGTWGYTYNEAGNDIQIVPIGFAIPLEGPLDAEHVHYIKANGEEAVLGTTDEVPPTECAGGTVESPAADPGNLCVFASKLGAYEGIQVRAPERINNPSAGFAEASGAATSGTVMVFEQQVSMGWGTWAVTAE